MGSGLVARLSCAGWNQVVILATLMVAGILALPVARRSNTFTQARWASPDALGSPSSLMQDTA